MDPKMDSGLLEEGETIEDDFQVLRELLPEEVVGLMDQMLCQEVRTRKIPEMTIVGSNMSDADPRIPRWHGIWAIRSQHPFSRHII